MGQLNVWQIELLKTFCKHRHAKKRKIVITMTIIHAIYLGS